MYTTKPYSVIRLAIQCCTNNNVLIYKYRNCIKYLKQLRTSNIIVVPYYSFVYREILNLKIHLITIHLSEKSIEYFLVHLQQYFLLLFFIYIWV